ncbi:MAG: T9SS type A sorting domain-containing protein, partial [candidate division Zixibacteria bacterium]|nr:T9SS type A sorting domain-containing protein [candidate division Zixibacteria bacterium]
NYPNPFNPKTTISYDLGVDAHVTLTIYNILGAAVKVLVDEYQSANNDYTVVWDGTDLNGLVVSSGVYFYRLSAGEFSETKKMMLMK